MALSSLLGSFFGPPKFVRHNARPKVIIVGDSCAGKTSLLKFWAQERDSHPRQWQVDTVGTEEANYSVRVTCHNERQSTTYFEEIKVNKNGQIPQMSLSSAHACIVVFSLVDRQAFLELESKWISVIAEQRGSTCPVILVGTREDLRSLTLKNTNAQRKRKGEVKRLPESSSTEARSAEKENIAEENDIADHKGIGDLPAEVLMHIFQFLPTKDMIKFASSSKRLYKISKYPFNWKERTKGIVTSTECEKLKQRHSIVSHVCEIGIGGAPKTRKSRGIADKLLRHVIVEAATSGHAPKANKKEEEIEDDFDPDEE